MAGIMVLAGNLRAAISSLPPVFPDLASALHLSPASIAVLERIGLKFERVIRLAEHSPELKLYG